MLIATNFTLKLVGFFLLKKKKRKTQMKVEVRFMGNNRLKQFYRLKIISNKIKLMHIYILPKFLEAYGKQSFNDVSTLQKFLK